MNLSLLDKYLRETARRRLFPGAVLWIGTKKETLFFECYGFRQLVPSLEKMTKDTIFDLASVTKPTATALAIMLLHERMKLRLEDPVEKFLISFKNKTNGKKTIKELLTHASGIPAWFPTYLLKRKNRMAFLANLNTGTNRVIYSCLGYIILGEIIESITKCRLHDFCEKNIFRKIGLENTFFCPSKKIKNIAATELGNEHEKAMTAQYGDPERIRWRDYLIKGEVHDGNCFYSFNGVSGNAGLFSNAQDLAKLIAAYLKGEIVNMRTLQMMTQDHTGGNEKRGLGWVIDPYPGIFSSKAFSHTGFTGTLVCVDPIKDLIIVFLTNVIHPKVRLGVMPGIRRKVVQIISKTS